MTKELRQRVMTMKNKNLIWVYPPNNWISNFNKTFIYGWCNPKAKLFVSVEMLRATSLRRVKIFPNGNFAQTVKLPNKKNIVKLIQIVNKKKKILSRLVICHLYPKLQTANHKRQTTRRGVACNAPTIIIDPGHGGKEHGTHSPKGIPEKHFNLQIAKMLYKKLCRRGVSRNAQKIKVYLTRSIDKFVSLKQRVNFAKKKKCNIFISIHHNALPDNENPLKHKGISIYYTHDSIKPLVKSLLESISKETKLKKYGMFKRDFAVTKPDFYRGILIECGFLIHPEEGEYITKRKVQEKIVKGIVKGI
ncbi:MAG: hypothetical protein A3I68_00285 [Candidatus Melainabacteria bacterium RIFCSPLOWO2_02_FULL_35_15]|nr:MAG: hypothetical protein A3F80_06370 [Candidatus Melainabacteria bacterium RIFCSPLOWO2_12_FULL_35_11]OGI13704.1 MAG: hypothetical protein A3I68_00285 [Candidatus Melainabacteria bacterium RIFCSPLOWO2_02_FULL_35_15]